MQIDERIRMLTPNIFEDQVTVTDPEYLTAPWKFTWKYVRKPGYKILEYVCEANREYQDPQTDRRHPHADRGPRKRRLGAATGYAQALTTALGIGV
jgi:hypothetical protein